MKTLILTILSLSLFITGCSSSRKDKNRDMASGEVSAEQAKVEQDRVEELTSDWSDEVIPVRDRLISKYGQPDEATSTMLIWRDNGPWKKTVLHDRSEGFLEQTASLSVPPEKIGDIALFNRGVIADPKREEITSRASSERLNFLTLNLAKEIVDGNLSAMEARRQYSSVTSVMKHGDYTSGLSFGSDADTETGTGSEEPSEMSEQKQSQEE